MQTSLTSGPRIPGTTPIDDPRHPAVRRIADVLRSRTYRPKTILIDDAENIAQAIDSGVEVEGLYLTHSAATPAGTAGLVDTDLPRYLLADALAQQLFGDQKQSRVFALARAPRRAMLEDLRGVGGDVVVLDGVRIAGNIGAIIRSSCALGAAGIILVDSGLPSAVERRIIRASRGLVFALPTVLATRSACADFLRSEPISTAVLSADAAQPVQAISSLPGRLAVILGSERAGVSPELEALADGHYAISTTTVVESLNVSVAAGIALYQRTRPAKLKSPMTTHPRPV